MTEIQNTKKYDLEERTLELARRTREFVKKLFKNITNTEDAKQCFGAEILQSAVFSMNFEKAALAGQQAIISRIKK